MFGLLGAFVRAVMRIGTLPKTLQCSIVRASTVVVVLTASVFTGTQLLLQTLNTHQATSIRLNTIVYISTLTGNLGRHPDNSQRYMRYSSTVESGRSSKSMV